MSNTIPQSAADFEKRFDFLVAVDSDGCAMDAMTFKHINCFTPAIIDAYELAAAEELAHETEQFVNLFSKWRGLNRFPALLMVLDLLRDRPEVAAAGVDIPDTPALRAFCESDKPMSNAGLEAAIAETDDDELKAVLAWSNAVNDLVKAKAHGVKPFASVKSTLAMMADKADLIVVSQMPHGSCYAEWTEHGLAEHMAMLGGQELGTKTEQLRIAIGEKYAADHVLMVGDAPGDLTAAKANGVLFCPTVPGSEDASWQKLESEGFARFLDGSFAGAYQDDLIGQFEKSLPDTPPWK